MKSCSPPKPVVYCSFCGKSSRDCGPVIEGPRGSNICANCISLCSNIVDIEKAKGRTCVLCSRRSDAVPLTHILGDRYVCLECLDRVITAAVAAGAAGPSPPV